MVFKILFGKQKAPGAQSGLVAPPRDRTQQGVPKAKVPPPLAGHVEFSETLPGGTEITDVSGVLGTYVRFDSLEPFIPDNYRTNFALMKIGDKELLIVHTPDKFASRQYLDILRRVRENRFENPRSIPASSEVVKALHHSHEDRVVERANETQIELLLTEFIEAAAVGRTSDVHIRTTDGQGIVHYRLHGERVRQRSLAKDTVMRMLQVLYNTQADGQNSGTSWKPEETNDTSIERVLSNGKKVQLRLNTTGIYPAGNVQATMRVLHMDDGDATKSIDEIDYTPEQREEIKEMLVGSSGLVLLVGPTNSGKSTSMQAFIKRLYEVRGSTIKVATIEDPVEYVLKDAVQHGIPRGQKSEEEIRLLYAKLLGSLLRQDTDVAMVGEIRTAEQAKPVQDLVLAGRKILSTLHVYEVMGVFDRLKELGVPLSVLCRVGFLSGIVYQRLAPVLCPDCSVDLATGVRDNLIAPKTLLRVRMVCDLQRDDVRLRGTGCKRCLFMGIISRTPCAELLTPTEDLLALVRSGDSSGARNHWLTHGVKAGDAGVTAVGHAILKMREGRISPMDVETFVGKIEIARPHGPAIGAEMAGGFDSLSAGRLSGFGALQ